MFLEERQEQIMKLLKDNQSVRIIDLVEQFGVTRETLRKDLYHLEKQGLIRKVHGGAVLNKSDVSDEEPPYNKRSLINPEEKEKIARKAAGLVEESDIIYLDIGTTTLQFAKHLKTLNNITVITNSVLIAVELGNQTNIKVILSGGELRHGELSLSGPQALASLQNYFITKAFIGVGGLSEDSGFTDYNIHEAEVRRLMLGRAKETYALVDHSKMNITAFYKTANWQDIDVVITDNEAPSNIIKALKSNGVEVILV